MRDNQLKQSCPENATKSKLHAAQEKNHEVAKKEVDLSGIKIGFERRTHEEEEARTGTRTSQQRA